MAISDMEMSWLAGVIDSSMNVSHMSRNGGGLQMHGSFTSLAVLNKVESLIGMKRRRRNPSVVSISARYQCKEHCPEQHVHVIDYLAVGSPYLTVVDGRVEIILLGIIPYSYRDVEYKMILSKASTLKGIRRKTSKTVTDQMLSIGWKVPDIIINGSAVCRQCGEIRIPRAPTMPKHGYWYCRTCDTAATARWDASKRVKREEERNG